MLEGKPFLLVLDDAWTLEDVAPFRQFTAPGAAVLLTTRDDVLARQFTQTPPLELHELTEAEAVDLLTRPLPEAAHADPDGVRALARQVGKLPLALVLVGAELAAHAGQEEWIQEAAPRAAGTGCPGPPRPPRPGAGRQKFRTESPYRARTSTDVHRHPVL